MWVGASLSSCLTGNAGSSVHAAVGVDNYNLDNRDELALSKEQLTAIRQAVITAQGEIAEHEWDLREAYQLVMADLDESPVDADKVLANIDKALLAENEVKKRQVALLIELRNLLTDEQFTYLQSVE